MAELLKDQFGPEMPRELAKVITANYPDFDAVKFIRKSLDGFDALSLTNRARKIAQALNSCLPPDYETASSILIPSLGSKLDRTEGLGMAQFRYLQYVFYIAEYGINYFEASMLAQYEITQRSTAEFSIRRFLKKFPDKTNSRMMERTQDENVHVRRLVSEGTRPRLPWTPRLHQFQDDPLPVIQLLEKLKDDPELYVRRSVANNLNDIGKDNPEILFQTAKRWMLDATPERGWLVRYALRSAVKRGELGALAVLGYETPINIKIDGISILPNPGKNWR